MSYLTPDRTKPITARKLGDDFDRAAVLETLTQNTQNAARAAKKAEGKGRGYEKWATLHNSKQMAATVSIYEESGFSSSEEMEAAFAASLCLSLTISAWSVARNTA